MSMSTDYVLCSVEDLTRFRLRGREERRGQKEDKLEWDRKVYKRVGQEESVGQVRIGERRGNEKGQGVRGEERTGKESRTSERK